MFLGPLRRSFTKDNIKKFTLIRFWFADHHWKFNSLPDEHVEGNAEPDDQEDVLGTDNDEEPVAGPSHSAACPTGPSNPTASETEGGASAMPQAECYNQFLNIVMASISEVLDTHGSVEDIIMLTEEIRANLGEGKVNDLAEHLVNSGSDLGVNDFIHRCLMQGLARGLWRHVDGTWQTAE